MTNITPKAMKEYPKELFIIHNGHKLKAHKKASQLARLGRTRFVAKYTLTEILTVTGDIVIKPKE